MRSSSILSVLIVFSVLLLPADGLAQRRPPGGGQRPPGMPQGGGTMGSLQQPTPKPYAEVITKDAKSQDGVFKVHELSGKVLWEIPKDKFGRVFLWQTEVAQLPSGGFAYPGSSAGARVVSFERRQNTVYLRLQQYDMRTDAKDGLSLGVAAATVAPIISAFAVEAEGPKGEAVIDVTRLLTSDQQPFAVGQMLGSSNVDLSRSYIERIRAFPENIETRTTLTFQNPNASTVLVHYSLNLLPEKPMKPRLRDDRVGFFGTAFQAFGRPEQRAENLTYIDRFRLEKKDPAAEVSEPVKPIVFYISREVPDQFRDAIKKGVEDWQEAFLEAGFKNAIMAKNAPSVKEDPNWDPEDSRYSVIRWVPSFTENAMGPHVADPRSGETISAHIIVWHNILALVQDWYFTQAAATDPDARKQPFDSDLLNRLVEYVVAHEVGHTLGLEHNFKASAAYSVKQLRTPGFVSKNGVAGSIMSYSRFNYVAQPEDKLSREDLIGRVGPYDRFAIAWGYKPIPRAVSPDGEKATLDSWASQQVNRPELRFGNYLRPEDPTSQSECIGSDPIESTELGLKNIERVYAYLAPAAAKFGENYDELRALYSSLMGQRSTEIGRVVRYVGGVVETNYHVGRGGAVFTPVPKAQQQAAVDFLVKNGLWMPGSLLNPNLMNKLFPAGNISRVVAGQNSIVGRLLSEGVIQRLQDNEAVNGANAYTVTELVADLQAGVFSELRSPQVKVDPYRRALQVQYLYTVDGRINGPNATRTELNARAREGLKLLAKAIDEAAPRAGDAATKSHLLETRRLIGLIVNGKLPQPPPPAPQQFQFPGGVENLGPLECWKRLGE